MIKTSEWVSLGHPDKIADFISEYILDRYLERDLNTRYALEVMVKNNTVILGGEITSNFKFVDKNYEIFVKEALRQIGYDEKYNEKWGDNAININEIKVYSNISQQSSDIAHGVDKNGWGDQGIFFGYATKETIDYMPIDYHIAKRLGSFLYKNAKHSNIGGLDIKTQVSYDTKTEKVTQVIVAIPALNNEEFKNVKENIYNWLTIAKLGVPIENIIINGTGSYITHSSVGDCGITGRKLVVDFYGGNCNIGGGSPWTKDPTKSDLTLNLYMRKLAVKMLEQNKDINSVYSVKTYTSSCIGQKDLVVRCDLFDKDGYNTGNYTKTIEKTPNEIINELNLRTPIYSELCMDGLFSKL